MEAETGRSAGSGGVIIACYWRMEKGKGRREQPLASASERIGGYF